MNFPFRHSVATITRRGVFPTPRAWRQTAEEMGHMNRPFSSATSPVSVFELLAHQLGEQELRRRMWHFLPGVIALALASVPHRETVRLWVMVMLVLFGILVPAWAAIRYQRTYRRGPRENIAPSILGYVIPLTLLCLLCRSHVEIPLAATAIIAFGDGSATLTGLLLRGRKVPWNSRKSWAGLIAFAVVGTVMSATVFWVGAYHYATFAQALLCVAPVVALCSVLETLPLKLNDNITIGCTAAVLLPVMQLAVLGW